MSLIPFTKQQLEEKIVELFELLGKGMSEEKAREFLDSDLENFRFLKQSMYNLKKSEMMSKSPEEMYIDYIINQQHNLTDLNAMVKKFKKSNQWNAMVGAIRARSDIFNDIIKRGQEFSVIDKRPEEKRIFAGIAVKDMSNQDLKRSISNAILGLNKLQKSFGDGNILDQSVEELYPETPESQKVIDVKAFERTSEPKSLEEMNIKKKKPKKKPKKKKQKKGMKIIV